MELIDACLMNDCEGNCGQFTAPTVQMGKLRPSKGLFSRTLVWLAVIVPLNILCCAFWLGTLWTWLRPQDCCPHFPLT